MMNETEQDIFRVTPSSAPPPRQQSRPVRILATLISFIFHPVFVPTILTLAFYKFAPGSFAGVEPQKFFMVYVLNTFLLTAFFPIISILIMKGLGMISSIHLYESKERIIPLIATMIFYFWASHVAGQINAPFVWQVLMLGSFWNIIMLFMVNIFFKVSMHTTGAGGMIGMIIALLLISPVNLLLPLLLSIVVAGIIGTARLLLHVHKPAEIWLGYIMGALVQLAAYIYLK